MYDRSRYNWAASHILRSCKVHYGASANGLEQARRFLNSDAVFKLTDAERKSSGKNWYRSLATVLLTCAGPASTNIPLGQRRLYALLFAACAFKAGAISEDCSPALVLGDVYDAFGLNRMELAAA